MKDNPLVNDAFGQSVSVTALGPGGVNGYLIVGAATKNTRQVLFRLLRAWTSFFTPTGILVAVYCALSRAPQ